MMEWSEAPVSAGALFPPVARGAERRRLEGHAVRERLVQLVEVVAGHAHEHVVRRTRREGDQHVVPEPDVLRALADIERDLRGTLTGVGRFLKRGRPGVRVIAAEPMPGELVQGLRSLEEGFVPPVLDASVLDDRLLVTNRDAVIGLRLLLREEGILGGLSSGAAISVALTVARQLEPDPQQCAAAFEQLHFIVSLALEHEHTAVDIEEALPRRGEQSV